MRIAIVKDGPFGAVQLEPELRRELEALLEPEFDVAFPASVQLDGGWTGEGVDRALDQVLRSGAVDLLIAFGAIASDRVSRREDLPVPTIAPLAISVELQGLPRDGEASGVSNLNYLLPLPDLRQAAVRLAEITPVQRVGVLMYAPVARAVEGLRRLIPGSLSAADPELRALHVEGSPAQVAAQIPEDVDGVLTLGLVHWSADERRAFAAELVERRLPSLALLADQGTELGFLAAFATESDWIRLARRVALHAQRALLGENLADLPTRFERRERLSLNLDTARAIGVSPSFQVLAEARVIGGPTEDAGETLTLGEAVRLAVLESPRLRAGERSLAASIQEIQVARSRLLPQIELGGAASWLDEDQGTVRLGILPKRVYESTASLSQLIWDERAWASVEVSRRQQHAGEIDQEARRLDVAREASLAYLQLLSAQTLERVQVENLESTRSNLELARRRRAAGATGAGDLLRWQSEVARARAGVLDARRDVQLARFALNRALNRAPETPIRLAEASLSAVEISLADPELRGWITSPAEFAMLRDVLVRVALRSAPELRSLDEQQAAQQRSLDSLRRRFWQPSLGARAQLSQSRLDRNDLPASIPVDVPDRVDGYALGLQLSFPFFEGGRRAAEVRQALERLSALRWQRRSASQEVEHRVRAAAVAAGTSFARIELAREAAEAALESRELVADAYARGATAIVTLLDAQQAALAARGQAEAAEYQHWVDLMNLERALGRFEFLLPEAERGVLLRELRRGLGVAP